jgi:hypothetical protein
VLRSRSDDVSVAYGKPQIEADHCLEQPDCELDDLLRIFRFDLRKFVDELVPELTGAIRMGPIIRPSIGFLQNGQTFREAHFVGPLACLGDEQRDLRADDADYSS